MFFVSRLRVLLRLSLFSAMMALLTAPAAAAIDTAGALPPQPPSCDTTVVAIPPSVTPADVDRVLAFVARHRKWSIDSRAPGRIELSLQHRGLDAHLTLTYDAQQLTVRSRSFTMDGRPAVPTRWINAFLKDVRYEFAAKNP